MRMQSVKLEKWALVAEIVGAVAIVITLAVLVAETRRNTAATYAANYDQLASDMAAWRMQLAGNPEMQASYFALFDEGNACVWDGPFDPACDTGILVATSLFYIYERAYFAHEYGQLANEEWGRYERSMCGRSSRRLFSRLNPEFFTDEFVRVLENCLAHRTTRM